MIAANYRWVTTTIVAAFLMFNKVGTAEELNPRTFCPISGSKGQSILLIDTTDPLTQVAQERLKELTEGFSDPHNEHYLKEGNELIIYRLLSKTDDMEKPSLRVCNPGNPKDRTAVEKLTSGVLQNKLRWRTFRQRKFRAIPRLEEQVESAQSPLLEGMAIVSARHIPSIGVMQHRKSTRLLLFSDMLQHSDLLSHYDRPLPSMKQFKALAGYSKMDSDLTGVDVWLFHVPRYRVRFGEKQKRDHYYWWTHVIELFGGRIKRQVPL